MSEFLYKPSAWQQRFHSLTKIGVRHALGAGAAGPGKTTALLYDILDQITVEHERCENKKHKHYHPWGESNGWALHLRRTRIMLEQTISLARRSFKIIDPGVDWNETKATFTFTSGFKLQFGHCKDPYDYESYMSFQFSAIYFDELCLHPDTDVLTSTGWKPIALVAEGEHVLSMTDDGRSEYREVADTYVMPFDGELVSTANKAVQFAVTPKHNMPIGSQTAPGWKMVHAEDLPSFALFPFKTIWKGNVAPEYLQLQVPEGRGHGANANVADKIRLLDWAEFLGWYLSEGSAFTVRNYTRARGGSPVVSIAQTKPCPGLDALIRRLPWRSRPEGKGRTGYKIFSRQLYGLVKPFGNSFQKRVPRWILDSSPEVLSAFFEAFAEGDGCRRGDSVAFGLCNEGLVGDLQEIAVKLGRRATKRQYVNRHGYTVHHVNVYGSLGTHCMDRPRNKRMIRYKGPVYCIHVPETHTFLARFNGRMFWSGNTQFNEEQYDQITTRLRSTDPVLSLMLKVRSMSNPLMRREGTDNFVIHDPNWVRRRFVDPCREGNKIFWKKIKLSDGSIEKVGSVYMPAKLRDNPDKEFVRQYETTLREQPVHIQKALLDGDWYVTVGSFFAEYWREDLHICKPFRVPSDWRYFRSMDWGFKAFGCILWFALDEEDTLYVIKELKFRGKTPEEVSAMVEVIETSLDLWDDKRHESRVTGVADTQLWEQRGNAGKNMAEVFREKGVPWRQADKKSRQTNAGHIIKRLRDHDDGTKIPGLVFFNSCSYLVTTLPAIQTNTQNSEEPSDSGDVHGYDALSYGCAFASKGRSAVPPKREPKDEWEEEDVAIEGRRRGRHGYGQELC